MTTEVFNGNEEPTLEEKRMAEQKTVGQQQTEAVLALAQLLQDRELEIHNLKIRVKDLEDLLSAK